MSIDIENNSNKLNQANNKVGERKALGRGLAALFNDVQAQANPYQNSQLNNTLQTGGILARASERGGPARSLPLEQIQPNHEQPRKHFDEAKLAELADSIREQGLVQPIIVRKESENKYIIVAGERRFRASKIAGLKEIPVYIRDASHTETQNDLASLVENIQREELNPIELAEAYERLLNKKTLTQETLAKKLGISRVAIANTLRLLKLPQEIRQLVIEGKVKEGHARVLLSLPNESLMQKMAEEIVSLGLSVRDVENRAKELLNPPTQTVLMQSGSLGSKASPSVNSVDEKQNKEKSAAILALEEELRRIFGTKVNVKGNAVRGVVEIYYAGSDSLNRIIHLLRASK
jgi:ParB family chromosome partitioning protein